MNNSFFSRNLLYAVMISAAVLVNGCKSDSGPGETATNAEVRGTLTFSYTSKTNPFPAGDSTNYPSDTSRSAAFPGRIKIAFNPANASGTPTAGPVIAIPGLGDAPGIAYSATANGVYNYSTTTTAVPKLENGTYRVGVAYVNPYLTGQAAQQELAFGVANVSGSTVTVNVNADMKVAYDSMLAARNRVNSSGIISGSVTASNPDKWPIGTGAPTDTNSYLAITAFTTSPPSGGPLLFKVIPKPTSGSTATFSDTRAFGTFPIVTIQIYKGMSAVGAPLATLPAFTLNSATITLPAQTITFP